MKKKVIKKAQPKEIYVGSTEIPTMHRAVLMKRLKSALNNSAALGCKAGLKPVDAMEQAALLLMSILVNEWYLSLRREAGGDPVGKAA